eukprot:2348083-Pleurochrysis_carterae.AAC.3
MLKQEQRERIWRGLGGRVPPPRPGQRRGLPHPQPGSLARRCSPSASLGARRIETTCDNGKALTRLTAADALYGAVPPPSLRPHAACNELCSQVT